jgi:hypothetical protein
MKPYHQTTTFTTAASSLLTILTTLKPEVEATKEKEFDIWKKTVNLPTRGSSVFALANYAKQHGLNPKVVVENKAYNFPDYRFYRYKKEDVEQAKFSAEQHLKEAEKSQVNIEEREIKFTEIKKLLENNILLLRLNIKPIRNEKKNTSNFIVVNSYENNYYHVFDPALGALSIPEEVMKEAFETLQTKKYRDNRMIIFTQQ